MYNADLKVGHSPARPVFRSARRESWQKVAPLRRPSNGPLGRGEAHPRGLSSHLRSPLAGARYAR